MKSFAFFFALIAFFSLQASAQQTPLTDTLLARMTGKWVLKGKIAGHETTHDIDAYWVLGHQYIQMHEKSREKDAAGNAMYEAIVFIGADPATGGFAILWLDTTGGGGLIGDGIGHGTRSVDEIAFMFKPPDGVFHTTFVYDQGTDTWKWIMDNEADGRLKPFARVTLKRK